MNGEGVSVAIPVFNEDETIGHVLADINKIMSDNRFINECIVIDDGSDDGTEEMVRKYNVRYLRNERRYGYGAAIKKGVGNAAAGLICIIDGDNTYSPYDIPRLYEAMGGYDMAVGARSADIYSGFSLLQHLAKNIVRLFLRGVFGINVPDINSGLILVRKGIIKKYEDILSNSFSFSAGIILAALLDGYRVIFVPVRYSSRGHKSKVNVLQYIPTFIRSYCKVIRRLR